MKLHKKIVYFKNIRHGKEPCKYEASQPNGVNTDVYATIKLDPILRKKKLRAIKEAMVGHEVNEISRWAKGAEHSHQYANSKEPAITRTKIQGVSGFWSEVDKMKKKGELK
jgi:hypothetical protein